MAEYDWTQFTISADFNTDARTIYDAWTTPAGLESWFLRKANFYANARQIGIEVQRRIGRYRFLHGQPDR